MRYQERDKFIFKDKNRKDLVKKLCNCLLRDSKEIERCLDPLVKEGFLSNESA